MSHEPGKRKVTMDTGGLWFKAGTIVDVSPLHWIESETLVQEEDGDPHESLVYAVATGEIWSGSAHAIPHHGSDLTMLMDFSKPMPKNTPMATLVDAMVKPTRKRNTR